MLGDFNTDFSSGSSNNQLFKICKQFVSNANLSQLICQPTRVTSTTSTIIDLILVTDNDKISQSGVLNIGLSDHMPIYCTRKIKKQTSKEHNCVKLRSLKNYSKESYESLLSNVSWSSISDITEVDDAWLQFKSKFLNVLDKIAPMKQLRVKQGTDPWLSGEILHLIQDRNYCLKMFNKTKQADWYDRYKCLRNSVQNKKADAKSEYLANKVEENKNNPKKLWQTLKSLGTSSKDTRTRPNFGIKINNEICSDKSKVADTFNQFFTTVASSLLKKLPTGTGQYGPIHLLNYYSNFTHNNFSFRQVTEEAVKKILLALNSNKATGLDQIPSRFLKDGALYITTPLTHILNLSLAQGKIPTDLKLAKITPIYKKQSKTEVGNYRPVSILSVVSKIFEKAVYEQVNQYLTEHKILYELQSGFRPSYSTDSCLIHLTDYIKSEQDKGKYTGMVLLDLQKAFDTVDHSILLQKLEAIGLHKSAVDWFRAYLNDRQQCVDIGGVMSSHANVTCGVPQGSILGPLLFLVYVNDMPASVNCKLLLYADDSALLVSGKSTIDIQCRLSSELQSIREWLIDNKLSLHLGKTESILFGSKRRLHNNESIDVTCDGQVLDCKSCVKYLGVELDQSLSGSQTAEKIISKSNAKLKFLYRQTRKMDFNTKKLLVSALIQCHMDYASASWYSGLTKRLKTRLQTTQNKVVRFMLNAHPRSHIGFNEFKQVSMLPVEVRVKQLKLNHMHNIIHGKAPSYLTSAIQFGLSRHNTRSGPFSILLPSVKSFGLTSFYYTGATAWNSLSSHIKSFTCKSTFKSKVKDILLNNLLEEEMNPFTIVR